MTSSNGNVLQNGGKFESEVKIDIDDDAAEETYFNGGSKISDPIDIPAKSQRIQV